MRIIKFRGKGKWSGKWFIGALIPNGEKNVAIAPFKEKFHLEEVDHKTVGQFTGLYDKNGREIYENDIVDCWSAGQHLRNGIIKWGRGSCGFFIGNETNSILWNLSCDNNYRETLEVVGNIHDNPEMLKGGEK